MSVTVSQPEPDQEGIKTLIRSMQQEIIDAQPHTFMGATTSQFEPTDYVAVSGQGRYLLNAAANRAISTQMGAAMLSVFGSSYPHTFSLVSDPAAYEFIGQLINSTTPLNVASLAYLRRLYDVLKTNAFSPASSMTPNLPLKFIPDQWNQRDYAGNVGAKIRPVSADGLAFMANAQAQVLDITTDIALPAVFQFEDYGWLVDAAGVPFIYDSETVSYYENVAPVPVPWLQSLADTDDADQAAFVAWLGAVTGTSLATVRDTIKGAVTGTLAGVLLDAPKILVPSTHLTFVLNQPMSSFGSPNYDFITVQDYSWIAANSMDLVPQTFDLALTQLGYAPENVNYFLGQVLVPSNAPRLWRQADTAWGLAQDAGILNVYPWAYTQNMRDNLVLTSSKICGC